MDNMFSGLESLGLGKMGNLNLFGDDNDKEKERQRVQSVKKVVPTVNESELLLDRTYKCPLCDQSFKSKAVKTGKTKLISQDIDLRPHYNDIDTLKYGVVACPICGYAAMGKTFELLGSAQAKLIKEQISVNFTGLDTRGKAQGIYTYDDAIMRHKLALLNAVVKRAKISERAYLCLLLAWLTRGKAENLPEDTGNRAATVAGLKKEEQEMLSKARDGFKEAFEKESFPLCGLDESTATYLVAALLAETGEKQESMRWIAKLITSTLASDRIKDRARNLKDMINNGEI